MGHRRVTMHDDDVGDWDTEFISGNLGKTGLLPLAMRRGAGYDGDLAAHFDADAAPFPTARCHHFRWPERADFDVGGNANAKHPAGLARRLALLEQFVPAGNLLGLLQRALVIAAVVSEAGGRHEGKLGGFREILLTHLDRIQAEFGGDQVHQAFDHIGRFGPARATVGVGGHLVGVNSGDVHPHRLALVTTGEHEARQRRDCGGEKLAIGADVRDGFRSDGQQRSVLFDRHFIVADLVASMDRGGRVFATGLDPLDWRAQTHCEVRTERFLGVEVEFRAEAAPDLGRHDSNLVLGHANHARQQRPDQVRNLRRGVEGERTLAGVP